MLSIFQITFCQFNVMGWFLLVNSFPVMALLQYIIFSSEQLPLKRQENLSLHLQDDFDDFIL